MSRKSWVRAPPRPPLQLVTVEESEILACFNTIFRTIVSDKRINKNSGKKSYGNEWLENVALG